MPPLSPVAHGHRIILERKVHHRKDALVNRPASYPWIEKLISYPTIAQTSNLELLKVIEQEFTSRGFEPHYTYSPDGERANLFVTLPSADGRVDGGILLSGHTDVVPVEGQVWDTDPFSAVIKGDKIFGRGVADMKSFLAATLHTLPDFASAQRTQPLHFAFTYDEEIGCLGAPSMIEEFRARGIQPAYAFVGEPSMMKVIVGHKSAHRGRVTLHGIAKHASLAPQGVNALQTAARFISFFETVANGWAEEGPFDPHFEIQHSTGGVNFARGGIQYNIVAEDVVLEYDFRSVPATPSQSIIDRIDRYLKTEATEHLVAQAERAEQAVGLEPGTLQKQVLIEHEMLAVVPALDTRAGDSIIELGAELTGRVFHAADTLNYVPYGTEGGQYQQIGGISTVVCGPGDIAQAHTPNEWIELSQVQECELFMQRVLDWASR